MQPPSAVQDISILIPAYNAETTIADTLMSIQEQESGLDRIEAVYLADDASLDRTVDVAKSAWRSSVRLQILQNRENLGERQTVNAAVDQFPAGVRWFFLLHADDIAKPNWLGVMLRALDTASSETASVTASYDVLRADGSVSTGENRGEDQLEIVKGEPASITGTLLRGCWWKVSSCSIRVSAFLHAGGFAPDMPQLGDLDFVLRLLRNGAAILYIPLVLSTYRQTDQSVSSVSFRIHRDVGEWLRILERYAAYLTAEQWRARHLWLARSLLRRTAGALIRLQWSRASRAIGLLRPVVRSAAGIARVRGAYDRRFFEGQYSDSRRSASRVVPLVLSKLPVRSAIDVGCGIGCFAAEFHAAGVRVVGIDGEYVDRAMLEIPKECFITHDLNREFRSRERFDLAVCLEVAEHLPESRAAGLIADLVRLAPCVMFSAAVPDQGGHRHINEQPLSYWAAHFARHDYRPADWMRSLIWEDESIAWWFRQNMVFFAEPGHAIFEGADQNALDLFHPVHVENLRRRSQQPGLRACIRALPAAIRSVFRAHFKTV